VQLVLSFLETSPEESVVAVWPTLSPTQKNEIVAALARLMAKAVDPQDVGVDGEVRDE
jgi:hypothetical protein